MREQELKNAMEKITISKEMQSRILKRAKKYQKKNAFRKAKKSWIPAAVAAALLLNITAFAAVFSWSHGFLSHMQISKDQMEKLQSSEESVVSMPQASVTHHGITVSVAQCLFDGSVIRTSFYIDGYELDETQEPQLNYLEIFLDGKPIGNNDWNFFNGIDWTDRQHPVMADGSAVQEDEEGNFIFNYRIADGKMELDLNIYPIENGHYMTAEELNGKKLTVSMHDFGETSGTWTLEWNLDPVEAPHCFTLQETLGSSGATVTSVTLYSSSAIILYDFPKTIVQDTGYDETNGKEIEYSDFLEPPELAGVILKDGTVYTNLFHGGSGGYENDASETFTARVHFSRIIDTDEIESLLFLKNPDAVGKTDNLEEDYYLLKLPETTP